MTGPQLKTTPGWEQERAELERVLASNAFRRSPRLHQFLAYICQKLFQGEEDQIKEYSIAVEALGRSEDFDHTRDSIVRVEAHRLRKRLAAYYEGEGKSSALRLTVPPGGYLPTFEDHPLEPAPEDEATRNGDRMRGDPSRAPEPEPQSRRYWLFGLGTATAAATAWALFSRPAATDSIEAASLPTGPLAPPEPLVRFSAGMANGLFVDEFGRQWANDPGEGGRVETRTETPIARSWNARLFSTMRLGRFRYEIPLEHGFYEMHLYFAETGDRDLAALRHFRVLANGEPILDNFNVLSDAGGMHTASVKVFSGLQPGPDCRLRLEFAPVQGGEAMLQGLELYEGLPDRMRPMRLLCGRTSYFLDDQGGFWSPDRFFEGGTAVLRSRRILNADRPNLFGGERYGQFRYLIPVRPGKRYKVKLYFAETWFGEPNPGGGGDGSRLFDLFLNGEPALEAFDVHKAAGGPNLAIDRTFKGVAPTPHDKIEILFRPRVNFGMANAVELIEQDG